ncbi:hypothetical protein BC827DRAFT_1131912 [Russula dissimulans]|nr:hypothetical protein BC827DRAFT_1131912 [Russula dissimulans]
MAANSTVAFEQHVTRVRDHALLASAAWLIMIPIGTLLPRYIRTFTTARWWLAHAFLNFVVSGPLLLASFMIIKSDLPPHFKRPSDTHKRVGLTIFGLYLTQCVLGLFVHYVRIPFPVLGSRPPQNYFHAVLGLATIGLAVYQVYTGIYIKWPHATKLPLSDTAKHSWMILAIVSPAVFKAC